MLTAKPKAEADNTYWDLDYLGYFKNFFFLTDCFEESDDEYSIA